MRPLSCIQGERIVSGPKHGGQANLPVFPTLRIDYPPVGEGHEELARLILDVDETSYEVVDVFDRPDLGLVDVSE